ncbi:uncharacterized protein LOC118748916 isoform X1 [Rhagoletis pomonella]|uniref:uncharacterized protein LOC118748916 isoform X1 n=1 Tax=Rhagoletis pomonella TaxID=28610 RepID=UPI00177BC67A|nr:uncharacterized protein LOC118748916 isoform X1 [Rhagoletis pomonella]
MACRLCLNKPVEFLEIFKDNGELVEGGAKEIIEKYFQIQITFNDEISNKICLVCWRYLNEFHKFWLNIKEKQQTLQIAFDCMRMKREASEDNAYRQINATLDGKNNILCEPELNIEDIKGEENVAVDFDDDSMNEDPSLLLPKDSDETANLLQLVLVNQKVMLENQNIILDRMDSFDKGSPNILGTVSNKKVVADAFCTELESTLPLRTLNAAKELEHKLVDQEYLEVMKAFLLHLKPANASVDHVFRAIFTDDFILRFNWNDCGKRRSLNQFSIIMGVFYDVCQMNEIVFEKSVRRCIRMSHHRHRQRQFRLERKHKNSKIK